VSSERSGAVFYGTVQPRGAILGVITPVSDHVPMILLVDDDAITRYAVERLLRSWKYCVISSANGEAAIQASADYNGTIDLLCTDVRLTDVDGLEVAARIREHRPDMRALFITGYTDIQGALVKPFTDDQLRSAVELALV
jgi:CheY-like chemotaxis protein